MITFHEIRGIIRKMAILSGHITELNELLPQVVLLSEKIDSLNEDLTLERDRMTAKIRSVEVLGEILRTHVYNNQPDAVAEPHSDGSGAVSRRIVEDELSAPGTISDSNIPGTAGKSDQSGFYPRLDGSSMTL